MLQVAARLRKPLGVVLDAIHRGPLVATEYPTGLRIRREDLAAYQRVR